MRSFPTGVQQIWEVKSRRGRRGLLVKSSCRFKEFSETAVKNNLEGFSIRWPPDLLNSGDPRNVLHQYIMVVR